MGKRTRHYSLPRGVSIKRKLSVVLFEKSSPVTSLCPFPSPKEEDQDHTRRTPGSTQGRLTDCKTLIPGCRLSFSVDKCDLKSREGSRRLLKVSVDRVKDP